MAKRVAIPYKDVKLRIVGTTGDFFAHRVQRIDIPVNLPNTVINEHGNPHHVGIVTDVPEVTATFQAFDVSHVIYSYLTGTDPTNYPASGVDIGLLGCVDLVGYVKEASVAEHLKCIHARNMRVTDFTFTYSVDGESTEEYSYAGSEKRYLSNDVYVNKGALTGGNMTLSYTPKVLKNGDKLLSMIVNGVWLEEGPEYSVAGTTVSVSGASTEYALAVYHTASGVMTWTDILDNTVPVAIRGKNVPVTIGVEHQYRVQSVTIRGTFPNTAIKEMGNIAVVGYITEVPEVTGDISVMDTDLELVTLLTTGSKTDTDKEYSVSEYESQALPLEISLKDPVDNTTVMKTVKIPQIRITSDGTSSNVGGQLTQTFAFQSEFGTCIVFSGASI
jgi:hypothetical protein